MTLENDLVEWVVTRPDWQKDAVAHLCRNETYNEEDIVSIADRLVAGTYPSIAPITPSDIPGSSVVGDSVRLKEISEVVGVNALLSGQNLSFSERGLTVIYGDNASGKSGYPRLIREAVTARVKGNLLGNVFSDEDTVQEAKVGYSVGDVVKIWNIGDDKNNDLSRIRFFDKNCGEVYVTTASEISYRPSALTLLDRLSDVCVAVQQEFNTRLAINNDSRPQLPMLHAGSLAATFLESLDKSTTTEAIDAATALAPNHRKQLAKCLEEEARLRGSDPAKEKTRLLALAKHWSTLAQYVKKLATALGDDGISELASQHQKAKELRAATRIASTKNFDSEPLAGVGSETWRSLWEAAREYSVSEAYHEHEFPNTEERAVCVLCQQPLSESGVERLARFQAFMSDSTARDADEAETELAEKRAALVQLQTQPVPVTTALTQLRADGIDMDAVEHWLTSVAETASKAVSCLYDDDNPMPSAIFDSVSGAAEAQSAKLKVSAEEIDDTSFGEQLEHASQATIELQDRQALAEASDQLKFEIVRLAARARFEEAKRLTETSAITRKRSDLTEMYVTAQVRGHFTRETEQLNLRRVTLVRTEGRRSMTLEHLPSLIGASQQAAIDAILSEGELTALALAGFLTEVEFDHSRSGVVFDDPVSSLDAGRRRRVAKRLVELAKERQVIIFTHEITFVHALNREARDESIAVTARSIQRVGGDQPGFVSDKHPWQAKDVPQRVDELKVALGKLRKVRQTLSDEQYETQVGQWAGHLSQTWERVVSADIVNELMDRGTNEVHPKMLKILPNFTQEDHDEFQNGYYKLSGWAIRHDNPPEENYVPPTPDELQDELERFEGWYDRVKRYKSKN